MLANIRLQNFRSYEDQSFEFEPGVNIIVGPNASGKTNLLEAILILAKGKSYRVKDKDLISFKEDLARVIARLDNGGVRSIKLSNKELPAKLYVIHDKEYRRLTLTNKLPVVLFEPTHMQLLSGSPEKRRNYLDDLLEQLTPGYDKLSSQYKRALIQRNHLLKQPGLPDSQIFPWNVRLSQLAGQIVRARLNITKDLNIYALELYRELSKSDAEIEIVYKSQWQLDAYESMFLRELENNIHLDTIRGFTSSGPHREDLIININKHNLQDAASRGEMRTVLLALKITELKLIEEITGTKPLLLLDDVFGELDSKRRHALTEYLKDHQTFITTTDADLVIEYFVQSCNVIALTLEN